MMTKEIITKEIEELKTQFQNAQQQVSLAKEQLADLTASLERLRGAIVISEKYLTQFEKQS